MTAFTVIDLERLPAPVIIEQPDFETIFASRKARLLELADLAGFSAGNLSGLASALSLESEPLVQLLQEDSYRELLLRAAVQDAGKGNLLAFAQGPMLDHIGALYGVERLVLQVADDDAVPPVAEILESDGRLRRRVQLAPEGFTTAGTEGSYIFWTLSASPLVSDVSVTSPLPKEVVITVLSLDGDGTAVQDVLDAVEAVTFLRRPLTDLVVVQSATIVTYEVHAVLTLFDGPDSEVVRAACEASLRAHVDDRRKLGHDITVAGLHAAIWQAGVQNIDLGGFAADLVIDADQAAHCSDLSVIVGGHGV